MAEFYDPIKITKLLVYGTDNPSTTDYNTHIRPAGPVAEAMRTISYNMFDYMTTGGGRFAYPSLFGVVEKFFTTPLLPSNYTYSYAEMASILNLHPDGRDRKLSIAQYGTGIGSDDHDDRSFIFGTTGFDLDTTDMTFSIINGVKSINGMEVLAGPDNYDFEGGNLAVNLLNQHLLEPTFDPYGLARGKVEIRFTGPGKEYLLPYDQASFTFDQGLESEVNTGGLAGAPGIVLGLASLAANGGPSYLSNMLVDP